MTKVLLNKRKKNRHTGEYDLQDAGNVARGHGVRSDQYTPQGGTEVQSNRDRFQRYIILLDAGSIPA